MSDDKSTALRLANSDLRLCIGELRDDDGTIVQITQGEAIEAFRLKEIVVRSTAYKALALQQIADRRLYLAYGCTSFKEFVESQLKMGWRSAMDYLRIGREFIATFPQLAEADGNSTRLLAAFEETPRAGEMASLGHSTLLQITKFDEPVFEEIADKGKFVVDTTVYTIDDLREMKTKEVIALKAKFREERRLHSAKVTELQEELAKVKSENAEDRKKAKEAEEKLKRAEHLERLYGEKDLGYHQQKASVDDFRAALVALRRAYGALDIAEDSDPTIVQPFCQDMDDFFLLFQTAQAHYGWTTDLKRMPVAPDRIEKHVAAYGRNGVDVN